MPNKQYLQNIPLSALREWDKNYRSITPQALLRLKNKIQALGVFKPLLALCRDADLKLQNIFPNKTSSVYEDEPPAAEEGMAFSCPGDFYFLGRHRLICGDSTKAETWARLMGKDKKADLLYVKCGGTR